MIHLPWLRYQMQVVSVIQLAETWRNRALVGVFRRSGQAHALENRLQDLSLRMMWSWCGREDVVDGWIGPSCA